MLEWSITRHDLPLADDFTIARGTTASSTVHTVELQDGAGTVGYGGAAPSEYYGETPETVGAVLPDLLSAVAANGDPDAQQRIAARLRDLAPDAAAARAAVSVAVHDLAARRHGEPLYRRWGLDADRAPATSYTVGIAAPAEMAERAARIAEAGYGILKVKLGTDDDRARVEAVREAAPEATIRADANAAWSPAQAVAASEWLADLGVEFIEQPVAADDAAGLARVGRESPIPVAADEACITAADVPAVAEAVDIVVVKVMKCGGLRPAIAQIATAHAHGLDVMLGCMVESHASLAGSCHLAPMVEYADLDGALLLDRDAYDGIPMPAGRIDLDGIAVDGTGVTPA